MSHLVPSGYTPNVRITNPRIRKIIGNTLATASLALAIAVLVDVNIPAIEYSFVTVPAGGILGGLFGIFQLGVTSPNVPAKVQPYGEGEGLFQ